jgi:hypothetical protein
MYSYYYRFCFFWPYQYGGCYQNIVVFVVSSAHIDMVVVLLFENRSYDSKLQNIIILFY